MNPILLTLGALTLGGSAAVLLLAWAGHASRGRYGAKWRCWAWMLLCLRLAIPMPLVFHGESHAPLQMDVPNPAITQRPQVTAPPSRPEGSQGDPVLPAFPESPTPAPSPDREPSTEPEAKRPISVSFILLTVWLTGAAAVLIWNGWSHAQFLSYLRRWSAPVANWDAVQAYNGLGDRLGLHRRPRLLVCQGLKVPMLAGLLRPAVLLPQGSLTGEELGCSLLHELTHYRRRDIWLKMLAMWVNTLYWFDPLMWYMVRLVERDTELACDEDALRALSPEDYAVYGQTILTAVARLQRSGEPS